MYRRFNIKTVSGPDDFASMEEVLMRRFKRWQSAQEIIEVGSKVDPSFSILPDVLIVDGGKGQLSRAVKVLKEYDLQDKMLAAGLAKEEELLFLPGKDEPLKLPRKSQGLFMVQRIRDEAHRFAITAHRNLRRKERLTSRLDQIPGIGSARKKALLTKFGSLAGVRKASAEEIAELPGISAALAHEIHEALNQNS